MDAENVVEDAAPSEAPAEQPELVISPELQRLLRAQKCVVLASDYANGLPFAWIGLAGGKQELPDLIGQELLLFGAAKMNEFMTAKATADYLARLKAAEQQRSRLVVPGGVQ